MHQLSYFHILQSQWSPHLQVEEELIGKNFNACYQTLNKRCNHLADERAITLGPFNSEQLKQLITELSLTGKFLWWAVYVLCCGQWEQRNCPVSLDFHVCDIMSRVNSLLGLLLSVVSINSIYGSLWSLQLRYLLKWTCNSCRQPLKNSLRKLQLGRYNSSNFRYDQNVL